MSTNTDINTIIVGGGAAGLACAACLQQEGVPSLVLEQSGHVGSEWTKRYRRLHLHTTKGQSALPFLGMPKNFPKYVSANDFAQYLNDYAKAFQIQPLFGQKVLHIAKESAHWNVATTSRTFRAQNVIVATGYARKPVSAAIEGMIDFSGDLLHSSAYTDGSKYRHKHVLVIGFGNSACEIAICLHEHGAFPSLSVRRGVNILPREIAGISVINIALAEQWLTKISPVLTDAINRPILRLMNGDIRKYGLHPMPYGPVTQIVRFKRVPLLDVGTMELIRGGKIKVYPSIRSVTADTVEFADGRKERFDAIISATGYLPMVHEFIEDFPAVADEYGTPLRSGEESRLKGLYFCGFNVSPTGMLREIGIEAKHIARQVKSSLTYV